MTLFKEHILSLAPIEICDFFVEVQIPPHPKFGYKTGISYVQLKELWIGCLNLLLPVVGRDIMGYESDPLPSYD